MHPSARRFTLLVVLLLAAAKGLAAVPAGTRASPDHPPPAISVNGRPPSAGSALTGEDATWPGSSVIYQNFLPLTSRESCPPLLDSFSDDRSGWQQGGLFGFDYGYANGEYFLRSATPGFVSAVRAPWDCPSDTLDVTVTGRWSGEPGAGFGVRFGPVLTPTLGYFFDVNPAARTYRVLQRTPGGLATFIPDTATPALDTLSPPVLGVRASNGIAVLSVNGVPLEEFDHLYGGPLTFGLSIATPPDPVPLPIEARFDDLRVSGY